MSCCLPCLLADRIEYRNGTRQLHSTQDYGRGRAAEITSMHLLRIASSSPVCSATWLAWLPTATPLPGRLHACRIHLHLSTVTALPASDSVLRAFFLRLCSTARLPVLTLPYILHQALTDSSRPQDSNSQTRGCSMAGESPLPLISPASLCSSYSGNITIPRGFQQRSASAPYGALHGETGLALYDAGSSK